MKQTFETVTSTILKKYKVTDKERAIILKKIDAFIHEIQSGLKKEKIDAYVMLGGSAAKGTFLKHDFDCDIFVRFIYDKYKEKDLSNILEQTLKKVPSVSYERVHGSRDYFMGKWKGMHYEIIPVLYITDKHAAKNITDMSPLHVEWLNKHLTEKLRDEILLTKLFFKAQKVYGAESYMHGFSGHVIDLLLIYYGSFQNLLKQCVEWQEKEFINLTPHQININAMNEDKLQSAIIIIDPVQPERNAAAAVGYETFYKIKNQATVFLENPSVEFFRRRKVTVKDIQKIKKQAREKGQAFISLKAKPLTGKLDTIGTKMVKAFEELQEKLKENDFTLQQAGWDWEEAEDKEALFWIVTKEKMLSETKEHMGPPLKNKKDAIAFQQKHKKTYFKNERLYAMVKRKWRAPEALARDFVKEKRIQEKTRRWILIKK